MDQTTGEIRAGMMRDEGTYDASNDPDMLQAQIAQTRRELSETIDQIQERLAPERLKREAEMSVQQATRQAQDAVREATIGKVERMMDRAAETAGNWRMNMMGTIRQNPIPAAMVGLGLGWLLVESRSQAQMAGRYEQRGMYGRPYTTMGTTGEMGMEEEGMMERMRERGEDMGARVGETAEQMQQRMSETADEMQLRLSETAEQARMRAQQMQQQASERMEQMRDRLQQSSEEARHTMQQMMTENPLAVGVAAMALGMGIGLLLPSTRAEDEMLGQYRDQFMEQAQHKAEETMEQVRAVAQEAQIAAKDAMKEVQEETKQAVEDVMHRTEDEARRQNIAGT